MKKRTSFKAIGLALLTLGLALVAHAEPKTETKAESGTQTKTASEPATTSATNAGPQNVFLMPTQWKNDEGKPVLLKAFQDKYTIMTMSYTNCRRICPQLTFTKLKELEKELSTQQKIDPEIVVVSLDPEVDTPEELANFRKHHGYDKKNWNFLVGDDKSTQDLAFRLGFGSLGKMDNHVIHDFKIVISDGKGHFSSIDWDHRNVKEALRSLQQ